MSLFARLLRAVDAWRRRRGGPRAAQRAVATVELLDHRQLLAVTFTGNVPVDFPATQSPGVVVIPANSSVIEPQIPSLLKPFVPVSGFAVQDIRVSYNAATDTLSIGLNGPPSGNPGQGEVIAGDADDNGNPGTVNPNIINFEYPPNSGIFPFAGFQDFPDFTGSEYMGAVLSFTGASSPQIVAGFSEVSPIAATPSNPIPAKPYEVALANPSNLPVFGTELPQFEGGYFLPSSPTGPNLEFSITHFSQLYQQETGKPLTPNSVIYVGAQAGSSNDDGIGELTFPPQAVTLSAATLPPPPPQSPTIYINPHEHRIVDTHHRDLIRVTIVGTSGFNVNQINPATVTLDGVHAIAHVTRKVRRDEFPMATYVFVANQLTGLHPGLNNVTLAGTLMNGTPFQSSRAVLNITDSARISGLLKQHLGNGTIYERLAKLEAKFPTTVPIRSGGGAAVAVSANPAPHGLAKLKVHYAPAVASSRAAARRETPRPRPVVTIPKRDAATEAASKIPTRLRHSLDEFLGHAGARPSDTARGALRPSRSGSAV